ncbi:MAG: hypothetical protein NC344_09755 [Bacteroidales bacterium]|nr:hypothetical protein [Bacteroidales bacterium]MCM1148089.1 hypothetical protein [Bacteroidales bacterium]MCM1509455.1 hypothetical protein [Clostridium sp.]
MKEVVLTDSEIDAVVVELEKQEGRFCIEIELRGTLLIDAEGFVDMRGFREENTGAWVAVYRDARVRLTPWLCGEEEEEECRLSAESRMEIERTFCC